TVTTLNFSLYNVTYFRQNGQYGNNLSASVNARITYSLQDAEGNYLYDTDGNEIRDLIGYTDSKGNFYIHARFAQRGVYVVNYTFPQDGQYLPVDGYKELVIQDFVNYQAPETIYRYYGDYPNLWVNVTNPENEGLNTPEGISDYDAEVPDNGVRYYVKNSTGGNESFTRAVINGKAVFSNATGWTIPDSSYSYPYVSFPEGYYYSFNITSQYLGSLLYANSTNLTTTVYVMRTPTAITIQNVSGGVSALLGENLELQANIVDLTGRNSLDGENV
ncbi:MAG: hypothetical protein BZ138_08350, partial [Methanosphaera sp. rholeuAM270]